MPEDFRTQQPWKIPAGTQVVALRAVLGQGGRTLHPDGAVGIVVRTLDDRHDAYRVRFVDGVEAELDRRELVLLTHFQEPTRGVAVQPGERGTLFQCVIYRCVIGSRAYGLDDDQSDVDYRGIYLPPAELQWSLAGVPDQIECHATQEHYWELQRFLVLALKANPNVLECLYTPLVEFSTLLADEVLASRESFLSRMAYQTFNGYVISQFKKMQADLRNRGAVKWKHVMHLLRLLLTGIELLRDRVVRVRVAEHREQLLAIKRGEVAWDETERWRQSLHREFDRAFASTQLPERPDYDRANQLLLRARRAALETRGDA